MKLIKNTAHSVSLKGAGEVIKNAQSIIILAHYRPDGDAIGSTLALGASLSEMGKSVSCINQDATPDYLDFLNSSMSTLQDMPGELEGDLLIALDCASIERLGVELVSGITAPHVLNIDHHITNEHYGDSLILDTAAAATGEIIYDLLVENDFPLPSECRDALYVAISTDTGSLQYSNATAKTYQTMANLVKMGAPVADLNAKTYFNHSVRKVEILRECLQSFSLSLNGQVSHWEVSLEAQERIGVKSGDMEGLMDILRGISGVRVCFTLEESSSGVVRLSMRSKDESVDVSKVCSSFGGGGHRMAAGAGIKGVDFENCAKQVLAKIADAL